MKKVVTFSPPGNTKGRIETITGPVTIIRDGKTIVLPEVKKTPAKKKTVPKKKP